MKGGSDFLKIVFLIIEEDGDTGLVGRDAELFKVVGNGGLFGQGRALGKDAQGSHQAIDHVQNHLVAFTGSGIPHVHIFALLLFFLNRGQHEGRSERVMGARDIAMPRLRVPTIARARTLRPRNTVLRIVSLMV